MSRTAVARARTRRALGPTIAGAIVLTASITGVFVYQSGSSPEPSSDSTASSQAPSASPPSPESSHSVESSSPPPVGEGLPGALSDTGISEADGVLPDGATVFDDQYPGIAHLDGELLHAMRDAATHAEDDGIYVTVNSGWRSGDYQELLLRRAVAQYGSEAEAARWVATAETSAHVSGEAIDVGPSEAVVWLSEHGAEYGLCQIYANEPWHYELRPEAADSGCPRMFADPTHDPRMQG